MHIHVQCILNMIGSKTLFVDSLERTELRLYWVFSGNAKFEFNYTTALFYFEAIGLNTA